MGGEMAVRFPIRLKILLVLLLVVSTVLGLITLTMANLYHKDKFTSINSQDFELATNSAAEARTLLDGHRDRISDIRKAHAGGRPLLLAQERPLRRTF